MLLPRNLTAWGFQGLSNFGRRATGWRVRLYLPCFYHCCWGFSRNRACRLLPLSNATSHGRCAIPPGGLPAKARIITSGMIRSVSSVLRDVRSVPRSRLPNSHPSMFRESLQGFLRGYP